MNKFYKHLIYIITLIAMGLGLASFEHPSRSQKSDEYYAMKLGHIVREYTLADSKKAAIWLEKGEQLEQEMKTHGYTDQDICDIREQSQHYIGDLGGGKVSFKKR